MASNGVSSKDLEEDPKKSQSEECCKKFFVVLCVVLLVGGLGVGIYFATLPPALPVVPATRQVSTIPCPKTPDMKNSSQYTEVSCEQQKCTWQGYDKALKIPYNCTYSKPTEYKLTNIQKIANGTGHTANLSTGGDNHQLQITCRTATQLQIKIVNKDTKQFEIPEDALKIEDENFNCANASYKVNVTEDQIIVIHNGVSMATIPLSNLVLEEQFLQLQLKLNSSTNYGFGEHNHKQLKLDMNYKTWAIFTRDVGVVDNWNLYGAHPFFMSLAHKYKSTMGVLLKNANAMDVYLQPNPQPSVTYRVIGGVLDFYLMFSENGPEHVIQDYTSMIGRPVLPPYWFLGFQLCRWGWQDLNEVKEVVRRNQEAKIPFDVVFGDIDYMSNKLAFTFDPDKYDGLPDFVDELKQNGTKYIIILDPGIGTNISIYNQIGGSYKALDDGKTHDVYVKQANGSLLEGQVWPGPVYFPDFTNPNTTEWWKNQIEDFYYNNRSNNFTGVKFDGLWVDMNEPANFRDKEKAMEVCEDNRWNKPTKYIPENLLNNMLVDKTICMDAQQNWGKHYDVHSLYGHSMAMSTNKALTQLFPEQRPTVMTRSSFVGTGKHAVHWLGDNQSKWPQIHWSIVGMLEFNMFGMPMVGADICGFWFNTTDEMCQRWIQVGAFYPYSRSHNGRGDEDKPRFRSQDPAAFNDDIIRSSREVLRIRYKLLPYLYTLMYHSHTTGSSVARALAFEFWQDEKTHDISKQFLWGSGLLISPALEKGQREVEAYFPDSNWYDYFTYIRVEDAPATHKLKTPLNKINLHIRGGITLPWQEPDVNTAKSVNNTHGLIVALDREGQSKGELYLDDGVSKVDGVNHTLINFATGNNLLRINIVKSDFTPPNQRLADIHVLGVNERVVSVMIDGKQLSDTNFRYELSSQTLFITTPATFSYDTDHSVEWSMA